MRALVTAGASGIGRAIAEALLQAGTKVHICDVAEPDNMPDVTFTRADVSSEADVDRLFADVRGTLGGLDVLVNNAGIAGPTGKIEDLSLEDLIAPEDVVVTFSHSGYVKSQPLADYRAQRRGGRGKQAAATKEDDFIAAFLGNFTRCNK